MRTKFKGYELVMGDMVEIDDTFYIVIEPISRHSTGFMRRLEGIEVIYDEWWKNLLVKLHLMKPNMWHDTITLYYNNTYKVMGNSYAN